MSLKFLVIQTSFLGDVILATAVVEKLNAFYPNDEIDFLVREGNEGVLANNPKIRKLLVWKKTENKYPNLFNLVKVIRNEKFDYVINLHRYGSSGLVTFLSRANFKIGFHNNPFSFCYTHKYYHKIGDGTHEVGRNQQLISFLTDDYFSMPKIYPNENDWKVSAAYKAEKYVCIAPGSVWKTKQLPISKWVELCNRIDCRIFILGSTVENDIAKEIISASKNKNIETLCTKLTLLQSAAVMKDAAMNYVNDSAPLHLCSAMNAPCTSFFCSTVPEFGFGPLSDNSVIVQLDEVLDCKPCGIHGYNSCPKGHFKCGKLIDINKLEMI